MRTSPLRLSAFATLVVIAVACSASRPAGQGGATSTQTASGGAGGHTTPSTSSGIGGLDLPDGGCDHDPDVDGDGDGWTFNEGDCNDCDPRINPGAIDVTPDADAGVAPADQDCSGAFDPPAPCDGALALDDVDPKDGARALELCNFVEESPAKKKDKRWGVISSAYVRADGTPFSPGLQAGLQSSFGPNVHPQGGARLLTLSTGRARVPGQTGACGNPTCTSNAFATAPLGFPQDNPGCPPSQNISDDVGLEVKLRSPTNATGYKFQFKFYSFEWPEWVCNNYNDQFIALASPAPAGSIHGNVSFDSMNRPVSVNFLYFDCCDPAGVKGYAANCQIDPCPTPPSPFCPLGPGDLQGTGFDTWNSAGATRWLESQAPVHGGELVTLRFAIWDTGDQTTDSTVLVDNFRWIAEGPTVSVSTSPVEVPK